MGVVSYRFNDAFMAAGRRVSATLPDGRDFWTNAVTPSGFIEDGHDALLGAFMPYLVRDNRTFDQVARAKGPGSYWKTPAADMVRIPDVAGTPLTDDLVVIASPPEGVLGAPVVRGGDPSWHMPETITSTTTNRYKAARYEQNWTSLARPDFYEMTIEIWWRPSPTFPSTAVYLARARQASSALPAWQVFHSSGRPRFRIYKADGVANLDASATTTAWNTDTMKLTTPVLHYVGTYDGLTARFYQNGVLAAEAVNDYVPDQQMADFADADYIIPLSTGVIDSNFPQGADIGPMLLYPRALSGAEIAENYLVGTPVK